MTGHSSEGALQRIVCSFFPTACGATGGGAGGVVDSQGEYIAQAMENNYCSHMSNKDKNEYRNKVARYVAHSVASHDELVAENERLRGVVDELE